MKKRIDWKRVGWTISPLVIWALGYLICFKMPNEWTGFDKTIWVVIVPSVMGLLAILIILFLLQIIHVLKFLKLFFGAVFNFYYHRPEDKK